VMPRVQELVGEASSATTEQGKAASAR
jgi:hypothetical protein